MMELETLKSFVDDRPGVIIAYKEEWNATRFLIDDKMFAMVGTDNMDNAIITMKLKPENGEFLCEKFAGKIVPGYYMNKVHWNSFLLTSDLPSTLYKESLIEAYELIFASLPKKRQAEILA